MFRSVRHRQRLAPDAGDTAYRASAGQVALPLAAMPALRSGLVKPSASRGSTRRAAKTPMMPSSVESLGIWDVPRATAFCGFASSRNEVLERLCAVQLSLNLPEVVRGGSETRLRCPRSCS